MGQAANANTINERRKALQAAIDVAIEALDLVDGDADLEPYVAGDDREDDSEENEPTLGWAFRGHLGSVQDGEVEPSLGWTVVFNQEARSFLATGPHGTATVDLEDAHDGREPDDEGEPDMDMEEDARDLQADPPSFMPGGYVPVGFEVEQ